MPEPEKNWHRSEALQASLAACKVAIRGHASRFSFATFPLPVEKKWGAFAIYAFCRWVDDTIDEAADPAAMSSGAFKAELDAIEAGSSPLPFAPAFAEVNRQYAIPRSFYEDFIHGCCMDRYPVIIRTQAELEIYCYHVASVVALIISKLFGLRDPEGVTYAVEMGLTMQLTHILRDVLEDFEKGRIYLPLDSMQAFDTGPEAIAARRCQDPAWNTFLASQIQQAREWYASAERGLPYLANDGSRFTARLMSRIYGGILDEIEKRDYDIFSGRVYVPLHRKILIALKSLR